MIWHFWKSIYNLNFPLNKKLLDIKLFFEDWKIVFPSKIPRIR